MRFTGNPIITLAFGALLLIARQPLRAAPPTCAAPAAAERAAATRVEARLRAAAPDLLRRYRVPGAELALVDQGQPGWSGGFGWAEPTRRVPVGPATLFQAGSVSKPVATLALLQLVGQGQVALDTPVADYLKRWQLPPAPFAADQVTLRRILSHTAGLSVPGYGGFDPGQPVQTLRQSLVGAMDAGGAALRLTARPGAGFAYSGGGFTLAQYLLEQVTGEPFARVAERQVLAPLAMDHSTFANRPAPAPPLAWTFNDAGRRVPARGFTALAAAGLQTRAADLARFVSALMRGPCGEPPGRGVLAPDLVAAMLTPQPHSGNDLVLQGSDYGLGLALYRLPGSDRLLAYHPGDNLPNWHSLIALIPGRRVGLVVMTNAMGGRAMRVAVLCTWLAALGEALPGECTSIQPVPPLRPGRG